MNATSNAFRDRLAILLVVALRGVFAADSSLEQPWIVTNAVGVHTSTNGYIAVRFDSTGCNQRP